MKWLKVRDAADYSGVSVRTLRTWLKAGLRYVRPNSGAILIKAEWIDEFLESFEIHNGDADRIVSNILDNI